jgi:non-ribosomal peptide synthetase component F
MFTPATTLGCNSAYIFKQEPEFVHHDWRGASKSDLAAKVQQFLEGDRVRGFDLTKAPLMRIAILTLENKVHRAVVTNHHIITDGWSHTTILAKIFTLYHLSTNGELLANVQASTEDGFKQFVEWSLTRSRPRAQEFWRGVLAGVSEPTTIPIIGKSKTEGTLLPGKVEASLTPELMQKLKSFSDKSGYTLSMTLSAAWGMLLHKYSGSNDIVFGSTVLIRPSHIDVNSVGLFMNTVPVRLVIDDEKSASDVVKALCKQQIDRAEYEHLALATIQACSNVPKGVPLMDSIFVVQNYPIDESLTSQTGVQLEFIDSIQKTNFALSVFALFSETSIKLLLLYDSSFVQPADANRMLTHYLELLNSFALNPVQPPKALPILTQQEKNVLLVDWNKTYKVYQGIAGKCAHELISERAKKTPNAIALVYPKSGEPFTQAAGKYTFQELEEMSNSLAQNLVNIGVKPDDLVGLSIEQSSWVMVVGMIAIWKAGGAYVALNPKLPADRLKYMIDKVNARVVLTMTHLVSAIKPAIDARVQVVPVDGEWSRIQSAHRPVCPKTTVAPNNLAYVIFTSGSTGLPKGVMIEHKALCHKMVQYAQDHLTETDRVAQGSAYSFDASVPEIFSTLVAGASVYLHPTGVVVGPDLAAFIRDNNITNAGILTPSRAATLKDESFPSLKRVIAGGEQLTTNIVKMMATENRRIFNAYLI